MSEVLIKLLEIPAPFNMIIVAVAMGIMIPIVAIISAEARKFFAHRADLEVKRDMVERGMSAEEIERILEAGHKGK